MGARKKNLLKSKEVHVFVDLFSLDCKCGDETLHLIIPQQRESMKKEQPKVVALFFNFPQKEKSLQCVRHYRTV